MPGKTNSWAGKFAVRIALSYQETASYFAKEKVAYSGQPIRKELREPLSANAFKYLELDPKVPVIFITGGSQGSRAINEVVLEALPRLVEKYQVIHQTGKAHLEEVRQTADVILQGNPNKNRFRTYAFMNDLEIRSAAGAAALIISRAGSAIFEIASWGVPSIIIPIPDSNGNHQVKNAFAYARTGAATVMQEGNLSGNILFAEVERIIGNKEIHDKMADATKEFVRPDAARIIAEEIIKTGLKHE